MFSFRLSNWDAFGTADKSFNVQMVVYQMRDAKLIFDNIICISF